MGNVVTFSDSYRQKKVRPVSAEEKHVVLSLVRTADVSGSRAILPIYGRQLEAFIDKVAKLLLLRQGNRTCSNEPCKTIACELVQTILDLRKALCDEMNPEAYERAQESLRLLESIANFVDLLDKGADLSRSCAGIELHCGKLAAVGRSLLSAPSLPAPS